MSGYQRFEPSPILLSDAPRFVQRNANPVPAGLDADRTQIPFRNVPFPFSRAKRGQLADLAALVRVAGEQNGYRSSKHRGGRSRRFRTICNSNPTAARFGRMNPLTKGQVEDRSRPVFVMNAISGRGSLPDLIRAEIAPLCVPPPQLQTSVKRQCPLHTPPSTAAAPPQ